MDNSLRQFQPFGRVQKASHYDFQNQPLALETGQHPILKTPVKRAIFKRD
jgi:hypothetical protein